MKPASLCLWAVLVGTLPALIPLRAQSAPASVPPAGSAGEKVVQLPAFEVSTSEDRGYRAVNSLAGGRTSLPLELIPSAISAITAEFIEDLVLTNIRQAYFWTVNVAPGNLRQQETIFGDYEYNIRGVGSGTTVPTRNYFHFYGAADTYNTERFEFARGPNSIVYGDAQLGGQPTTWTKVPRVDRDLRSLRFQADSYGGWRGTFDVNQRITPRFAARVNGLYQRGKDWRDGIDHDKEAVHLAARFRLTERTEIRAETEWSHEERLTYSINHADGSSYWTGRTADIAGAGAIPTAERAAAGVSLQATQPYFLVLPAVPAAGFQNWQNQFITLGTGASLREVPRSDIPNAPALPSRKFTVQPPDGTATHQFNTVTLWFDHRFTRELEAQVSYYYFDDDRIAKTTELFGTRRVDINRQLPDGRPNAKFGVPYSDAAVGAQPQQRTVNEIRGLATYRLATSVRGLDVKQRFTVAGGRRWFNFDLESHFQRRVNGPNPDLRLEENIVRYRLYWDEPRRYPVMGLPQIPGVDIQYRKVFFTTHTDDVLDYGQLVSNTTLWGDRISLLGGVRYDTFDRSQQNGEQTPTGAILLPPTQQTGHATTFSAGAVVYPFPRSKWLGFFYNYSENFTPATPGLPRFDLSPFGPTSGAGKDYGIRLNLADGRLYASFSRYDSKQTDRITGTNAGALRGLWRAMGYTVTIDERRYNIDFRDTESLTADGYEFEITANPTPNLRLTAGFSLPDTAIVDRLADTKRYNALHRATWEEAMRTGRGVNGVALSQAEINSIRSNLDALDQTLLTTVAGARLNGTLDHTGNVYATYRFTDGRWKDLAVGAGAFFRGRQKIGNRDPQILFNTTSPTPQQRADSAFAYTYAPEYYNTAMHVAYETRFGRYRTKFQLNIDNVLDDDDPRFYSINVHRVGGLAANPLTQTPGFFNYPDPRKVTFTATVSF
ncbi:MAG: TonB-dependent receptor [Opitutaceae bacterium]|nr:TonB-dependent receptor [Opitutaceae bacterium]